MIIPEVLAWSAHRWPDNECIVEVDPISNKRRSLTYRQFDERVNMVANALLDTGIKKGDFVLHFMRNRIEWLEAYFGIIRIGAIVVPLNFRFTSSDVKCAVDVVQPRLIIIEDKLTDTIAPIHSSLSTVIKDYICVGENVPKGMKNYKEFIAGHSTIQPDIQVSEEDYLGIYFTSGTTGTPKAILYTHKNLFAATISNDATVALAPNPNALMYPPLYHTVSFFLFPYLLHGGKWTLLLKFSIPDFLKVIEQEKCTEVITLVLPHCVDLITAQKAGEINVKDYDLSSLHTINTGAQPYPTSVTRGLVNLFPTVGINYGYGISEGGGATTTLLTSDEIISKIGSVGKPSFMVNYRIVDEAGNDVEQGEVGELILKTERMMREYYKNPAETAKTIRNGWLYTGDLAKVDAEGYIYIVDRKKDVIISGGENVYPAEVEEILLKHPKIKEAAVIGTPDEKFGERVTAIVTLKSGMQITREELVEWCKEKFPAYKRPRRIEFDDSIPKSATQKVLKPELRLRYGGKQAAF